MGLKKQNYKIKQYDITIPWAYAIIRKITIDGNNGTAEFAIQETREAAKFKEPFEKVVVNFVVNRNESPYVTAYNKAKKVKQNTFFDTTTKKITVISEEKGVLGGWEDDFCNDEILQNNSQKDLTNTI